MFALSRRATEVHHLSQPVSPLTIITLFSLVGLVVSLAIACYGIDFKIGM